MMLQCSRRSLKRYRKETAEPQGFHPVQFRGNEPQRTQRAQRILRSLRASRSLRLKRNDSTKLLFENVERAFVPDDVIRSEHFLFNWPLGAEALFNLLLRPAAFLQAALLRGRGACDANDRVEFGFGAGFEQQRNDHDRVGPPFGAPAGELSSPQLADARVGDLLESPARFRIGKHERRKFIAAQTAVGPDDFVSE